MKVFVSICRDRHCDDGITVHETREGADRQIEEFKAIYVDSDYSWTEENYGRSSGWVRYVSSGGGDGPNARIQEMDLQP